jgi:hypothetical protein
LDIAIKAYRAADARIASQQHFQFGEGLFDRVEVWGVAGSKRRPLEAAMGAKADGFPHSYRGGGDHDGPFRPWMR